jgi:hypothetical protein
VPPPRKRSFSPYVYRDNSLTNSTSSPLTSLRWLPLPHPRASHLPSHHTYCIARAQQRIRQQRGHRLPCDDDLSKVLNSESGRRWSRKRIERDRERASERASEREFVSQRNCLRLDKRALLSCEPAEDMSEESIRPSDSHAAALHAAASVTIPIHIHHTDLWQTP